MPKNKLNKLIPKKTVNVEGYPLVSSDSEGLTTWFNNNPNIAGMAIGAGLNGINGNRRVVLNPNLKDINARNSVYRNESYRHFFDENNTILPEITNILKEAYIGTPYEGLDRRIQETEASRYLSGDPSHHLNRKQKTQLNKFRFTYPGGTLPEITITGNKHKFGGNLFLDGGSMNYKYRGTIFNDDLKNQGITHVAELPEVTVKGKDYTKPYKSAFKYDPNFAKELPYFLPVVGDALDAADVARDVYNGNYLSAGIGAGMLALPNFIEKPIRMAKGSLRKARKLYKRLSEGAGTGVWNFEDAYNHAMHNRAYKIADEQGHDLRFGTLEDKNAFRLMYSRYINNFSPVKEIESHDYSVYGYTKEDRDRIKALFRHNPEYYVHVIENNIKDPLSQEAVNDFITRQLTSIRGVAASNIEDAKRFLTETQKGRHLKGGDRLETNGGLYVSNNPVIGDRFKNPVGNSTENGYVGILKEEDIIDRDQPIEEQLRLLPEVVVTPGYGNATTLWHLLQMIPSKEYRKKFAVSNRAGIVSDNEYIDRMYELWKDSKNLTGKQKTLPTDLTTMS